MSLYTLANTLSFSMAEGKLDFDEEKFTKFLNNNFGLSRSQFNRAAAFASGGKFENDLSESTAFYFQPGQAAREPGKPPFRDYVQITAVDYATGRKVRIFVRAVVAEDILQYRRPYSLFNAIDALTKDGTYELTESELPRYTGKPAPRGNSSFKNYNKPRDYSEPHSTIGDAWPQKQDRRRQKGKPGRDHREED